MFEIFRKTKVDEKINISEAITVDSNDIPADEFENVSVIAAIPQVPIAELIPYNEATKIEIDERIECFLKLNSGKSYNFQPIKFVRGRKGRRKYADKIGIPPDSEVTEEEFWVAYIKGYVKNVIKDEKDRKTLLHNSQAIDNTNTVTDKEINRLNEVSGFISGMKEKMNGLDTRQQEFFKSLSSQLDENPVLKMVENTFVFEGQEYRVTPKMKNVLLELSKCSEWTTAKKLSERTPESEGYISKALLRLKDKGYPIITYTAMGKRFWALEKGHKEKGKKGKITSKNPDNKSDLLLHALRQYKEINGRSPTATEISNQLKWDIFVVKSELENLLLNGKIKKEKIVINWKKPKVWTAEEK
jgi:hypothetical protein